MSIFLNIIDDDIGRQAFHRRVSLATLKTRMDLSDPRTEIVIAAYKDEAQRAINQIEDLLHDPDEFIVCPGCAGTSNSDDEVTCGECGCAGIIPNPDHPDNK